MRIRRHTITTVLAVVALTTAACSQGDDGGGEGGSSSEGGGNSAAETEVEQYLSPPEAIPIDQSLSEYGAARYRR